MGETKGRESGAEHRSWAITSCVRLVLFVRVILYRVVSYCYVQFASVLRQGVKLLCSMYCVTALRSVYIITLIYIVTFNLHYDVHLTLLRSIFIIPFNLHYYVQCTLLHSPYIVAFNFDYYVRLTPSRSTLLRSTSIFTFNLHHHVQLTLSRSTSIFTFA